jgi:tetratricopeptide (TPR) repeat protein
MVAWQRALLSTQVLLVLVALRLDGTLRADEAVAPKPPWQRLLQGDDARKAGGMMLQANLMWAQGKFAEALKVAQALADLREKKQGVDHWEAVDARAEAEAFRRVAAAAAEAQTEYAGIPALAREARGLVGQGRYREALPIEEKIFTIRRKLLGEDHPFTGLGYSNVAFILNALGRYAEAEAGLRNGLAIHRKGLGEEHPDTARAYNNLGHNLQLQAKYAEAEASYRKALAIDRKMLGEENPDTAQSYNNLAAGLDAQGKHTEAQEGHRKALAIRRKVLGEEHPDTAQSHNNAAANLDAQGKYLEAEAGHRTGLAIRRKVLGEEHPRTATSYAVLADNLRSQGKYSEAETYDRKALAIRRTVLGEEHPDTARSHGDVAGDLQFQGKYTEAEAALRKALSIRLKVLGEGHPDTALSYNNVAGALQVQGKYAEAEAGFRKALDLCRKALGEEHSETARIYGTLAANLNAQGKHKEGEELHRTALTILRKVLGETHPDTARAYNNVAYNLSLQGKYAEAEAGYRKALAIRRKALGEEHPDTAQSYNNVAMALRDQGRYAEAEAACQKALAIRRKVLGEGHPDTADSYNNLALILDGEGKYTEAEAGYRTALAIYRKVLGEEHPDTARGYNNLAASLNQQGRFMEAEEGFRKALAIWRKALGEEHRDCAAAFTNLASNLDAQGKYLEAEHANRNALAIFRRVMGDEHPETARAYNNLAFNLNTLGRYLEAAESYHKALEINRKTLGEEHPHTIATTNNIAHNLGARGKHVEAEAGYRKALAISRKVLGEDHPDTARHYNNLAVSLYTQGKYEEAEGFFQRGADCFAKTRLYLAATGLGRAAVAGRASPRESLPAILARNGKPDLAWQRLEEGLGRGTWDDLSARLRRPRSERDRQNVLAARLQRLDQLLDKAGARGKQTPEDQRRREDLLAQHLQAQQELTAFAQDLEKKYGPIAGQVFERAAIQAALPTDTALLTWVDIKGTAQAKDPNGEHWAVLLRSSGVPVWERLRGSGPDGAWTEDDDRLPVELRAAVQAPGREWEATARRLRQQRLAPLARHVDGVRKLVVLPSAAMAGIPVELIAEGMVSYHQSGTMFAHGRRQPRPATTGLLAVGDPVYDLPAPRKDAPLPPGGLLLAVVIPGSSAAQAGLRPNDVLLRYGSRELVTRADLRAAIAAAPAGRSVPLVYWREGRQHEAEAKPAQLGVIVAPAPAPVVLAELRRQDNVMTSKRGGERKALPGTRVEVEALRRLFDSATVLTDSDASEQRLFELARAGALAKYRYLHFATHGEVDSRFPLRSALILSRDLLPAPSQQLDAGLPVFDGELTAEKMLRLWNLDADLVTLSACQTALGKYEPGEGFVGFAQALMLSGTRSVCLSLWHVDDTATALLMERFYQNLLGKRGGLDAPMGKAAALAEAKEWLRTLPREQAFARATALTKGVARGKGRPVQPLLPPVPAPPAETRDAPPYAHPYYWAAFVLIGDPE